MNKLLLFLVLIVPLCSRVMAQTADSVKELEFSPAVCTGYYTSVEDSVVFYREMEHAELLWGQRKIDSAVSVGEGVLAFAREHIGGGDHPDLASSINNLAVFYGTIGRYGDAELLFLEGLAMRRRLYREDHPDLLDLINSTAGFYYAEGRYADAVPLFFEALEIDRRLYKGDSPELATGINSMAMCYSACSCYDEAEGLFLEALAMRRRLFRGDQPDLVASVNNMANFYNARRRYADAEPLLLEGLTMCRRMYKGDNEVLAGIMSNMAVFFMEQSRYGEAESFFQEALAIYRRVFKTDHPSLALGLNNMASFYDSRGRYTEVEPLYLEALAMHRRLYRNDHPNLAANINGIAVFYNGRGRYAEAEPYYIELLAMNRRLYGEDHPSLAASISIMAAFYCDRGRYVDAEPLYMEALAMNRRLHGDDHDDLANIIGNTAVFYDNVNCHAEAELLHLEALSMYRRLHKTDYPGLASIINNIGYFYYERGRYAEAKPLLLEALAMYRRLDEKDNQNLTNNMNSVAQFYEVTGYQGKAESLYLELLDALRRQWISAARFGSERDQLQFAATEWWRYRAIASFITRHLSERSALTGTFVELAMESKSSVLDLVAKQRHILAELRQHDTTAATDWERYVEVGHRLEEHLHVIPADSSKYVQWQQERIRLESDRNSAEQQLARTASPLLADDSTDWHDVQRALKPDAAAIEFLNFRYHDSKRWTDSTLYYAIIIRPGTEQPSVIRLCEQRELETILQADPLTSTSSYLRDADANSRLYNSAFGPIEQALAGARTIYLSPTGLLSRVSFAALQDSAGRRLADRFDLRYVSNTKTLARPADIPDSLHRNVTPTAAVFGGAMYDLDSVRMLSASAEARRSGMSALRGGDIPDDMVRRRGLNYLPGSLSEAAGISRLLTERGWTVECDTALRASEERFKYLSAPTVLHIATHGFFFTEPKPDTGRREFALQGASVLRAAENPMLRSGLLLSGAERAWNGAAPPQGIEDGIVTAYEIASMDLSKTELVVLSACGSGLGQINGSEGVFGLQRAFRIAGARSVLMTLWNVGDATTERFMREFYSRWLGGTSQHEAFAQAQAALRASTDDPRDWAAYVLVER